MSYNPSVDGLNTILPYDYSVPPQDEGYDLDTDLALFANTDFLEWDPDNTAQPQMQPPTQLPTAFPATPLRDPQIPHFPSNDFDFTLGNIDPDLSGQMQQRPLQQQQRPDASDASTSAPPSRGRSTTAPSAATTSAPGVKRNHASAIAAASPSEDASPNGDDALTVSAEEDKRRRNTAASARFRVKKKQREQQMEKTAKEMTDRVTQLENRIVELEKENRLLKGLLTEKSAPSFQSSDEPSRKKARVEAR